MKTSCINAITAISFMLVLSQCIVVEPGGDHSGTAAQLPDRIPVESAAPLSAGTSDGIVTIRQNGRVLCTFRADRPNIEDTRWQNNQSQIVVKSRGNHGPAAVQLFDARSGRELGRVMAYDIRGGQPAWAAGMGE